MRALNLLMTVLLTIVTGAAYAQLQAVAWSGAYGGSGTDYCYSIEPTSDGGYIAAGQTSSTNGDLTGRPTGRGSDAWVVKLDDTGAIQWQKWLGGTGTDYAAAIHQTSDGGYIVGGYTNSENGDVTDKRSGFGFDFWAVKLNSSGDIVWSKTFGSTTRDEAADIHQTFDGGYVMIGRTFGKADGDVSFVYSSSKYDYWVVKLRPDGTLEWEKTYGGTDTDDPNAIRQTADSGYILTGASNSSDGVATVNKGNTDFWVIKTDKTGAVKWQKSFGGTAFDVARDVVQAKDGGYLVVGSTNSQDGDINAFLHGNYENWVLKLDDTGRLEWQRILGGTGSDYPTAVELADDGGYLITGYSQSKDGDVSNGYGTNSNNDVWVVKLDQQGVIEWEKSAGGTGNDQGYAIYPTGDGGCIVAGQAQSSDGEVWNPKGSIDMFVVKLTPVPVDSVVVSVQGGGAPDITAAGATLQLEATVYPTGLSQNVTWSIVPVTGAATINASGLVTGQLNGTVWGKAVSAADLTKMDSILITLSGQVIPVDSVVVTTQHNVAAEINMYEGTLQLEATVYPSAVSQDVTWSVTPVTGNATVSTTGLVTADANGTVWVKAVSVADGTRMDSLMIAITGQDLNVRDVSSEMTVRIYPNPSEGTVYVAARDIRVPVRIVLSDICGREIKQVPAASLQQPVALDIHNFAPGIYVLHIKGQGIDIRQKITRQ